MYADSIDGGNAPARGSIKRLRVLFLPKHSRTAYFRSLLSAARAREAWDLQVVCADPARRLWRDIVTGEDKFHLVPDFNDREVWEDDPHRVAEIDAFILECEQASGVSAGRILLAGERDLGRGYSQPVYYWFHNETARRVLADNTEPDRIVRRMFAFARRTLEAGRPELVLAGEWADALCFTFFLVARRMGIACVVNRYSKILSGRCYWSAEPLMYNHAGRARTAAKREERALVSDRARQHIKAFREQPTMVAYLREMWDQMDRDNWFRRHVDLARVAAVELRHRILRLEGPPPKPALQLLWDHYRRPWLQWRNTRLLRRLDESALAAMRYIYIPLHKDPEQALNYQAPFWVSQAYTIGLLSSCLPYGYALLVRENRANMDRRPPRFYRQMATLPGVILIDGYDDQFKYVRNADLIITDNGSVGWEGLLLGRRVITLADAFYDGTGLERRVREPEQLAATVLALLEEAPVKNQEAYDQALGWRLDAEWEASAPLDSADHSEALDLLTDILAEPAVRPAHGAVSPA
jgi:hypothetical protein